MSDVTSKNIFIYKNGRYVSADSNATNLENGSTTGSLEQIHDGTTFSFVNPNSPLNGTTVNIGIANGTYATMLGGKGRVEGKRSFVNGTQVVATGNYAHAEGNNTHASGVNSHAEGSQTMSSGNASHSEGTGTLASGNNSHAFGNSTIASGYNSIAGGEYSKAEQDNTFSLGYYSYVGNTDQQYTVPSGGGGGSGGGTAEQSTTKSYAIGDHTQALGSYAFVGGYYSKITANGQGSFVYGSQCTANALDSAAIGEGLTTNNTSQFVCGRFNSVRNNTLFEVGNGTDENARSNAFEVYNDGHAEVGLMGSTNKSVATKEYVDTKQDKITATAADEGKVVVVDSNGNLTLSEPSGGTKLYRHTVVWANMGDYTLEIISTKSSQIVNATQLVNESMIGKKTTTIAAYGTQTLILGNQNRTHVLSFPEINVNVVNGPLSITFQGQMSGQKSWSDVNESTIVDTVTEL